MRREDMVLGAFILVPILAGLVICIKYCTFYDYFV